MWLLTRDTQKIRIIITLTCALLMNGTCIIRIFRLKKQLIRPSAIPSHTRPNSTAQTAASPHTNTHHYRHYTHILPISPAHSTLPSVCASVCHLYSTHAAHIRWTSMWMCQRAHIHVAISGKENISTEHSADDTITDFRFLQHLLLIHEYLS